MASRIDGKGILWALFFGLILLALFDVLTTDSVIVDFFTGGTGGGTEPSETRLERAVDRVLDGRRR